MMPSTEADRVAIMRPEQALEAGAFALLVLGLIELRAHLVSTL